MNSTLDTKAKKHFAEITTLIETMPELERPKVVSQSQEWLGDAHELVKISGDLKDADDLKTQVNLLIEYANFDDQSLRDEPAGRIEAIIHRARAALKSQASDLD